MRLFWYIFIMIIGAAFALGGIMIAADSFFTGFGSSLAAVAAVRLVQIAAYMKNPRYAEKLDIKYTDERNVYLAQKARSAAFVIGVEICAIGTVVLKIFGFDDAATVAGLAVLLLLAVYFVTYAVLVENAEKIFLKIKTFYPFRIV